MLQCSASSQQTPVIARMSQLRSGGSFWASLPSRKELGMDVEPMVPVTEPLPDLDKAALRVGFAMFLVFSGSL
jgi:hypothetical protein